MTCERRYTDAVVTDLHQITAGIEAERRRQYRAEMAQELGARVLDLRRTFADPTQYDQKHIVTTARLTMLSIFSQWLSELSPPVVCDDSSE